MKIVRDSVTDPQGHNVDIYVEVDPSPLTAGSPYQDLRGEHDVIESAQHMLNKSMELIHTCATTIVATAQKLDQTARPTTFEVQLTIKLDAVAGAILVKASTEAQLQVTMRWERKEHE